MTIKNRKLIVTGTVLIGVPAFAIAILLMRFANETRPPSLTDEEAVAICDFADTCWYSRSQGEDIPKSEWPDVVKKLEPIWIYKGASGIYIKLGSRFTDVWGYFVPAPGTSFQDTDLYGTEFRRTNGRLFWFINRS
jgi:hypothetical protein